MVSDLLSRLEQYCREKSLIQSSDSIAVAVSGGVDSVILLHLLNELKRKYQLRLHVAHFNHQLRGKESEGDEVFVRRLARKYGMPCSVRKVNTAAYAKGRRASLQEAARELRYNFFREIANEKETWKIATAHNANDNAETVLLNLCRGTGLQGLTGIPVQRTDIPVIRPLLFATKEEIEAYAKSKHLKFRIDSSNKKLHYRRNLIRKRILPLLEKSLNPEVVKALNRTSEILGRLDHMLDEQANGHLQRILFTVSARELKVNISRLTKLDPFLQETIVQKLAQKLTGVSLEAEKVGKVLRLVTSNAGKHLDLSKSLSVYRDRNALVFAKPRETLHYEIPIEVDKEYEFDDYRFSSRSVSRRRARFTSNKNIEYVDADRLNNRLLLRTWREGDWFMPLGMRKKKKLSDFFIDEKIPLHRKHSLPVLESHGNIVWICGVRLDNRYRLSPATRRILKLEFQHKES